MCACSHFVCVCEYMKKSMARCARPVLEKSTRGAQLHDDNSLWHCELVLKRCPMVQFVFTFSLSKFKILTHTVHACPVRRESLIAVTRNFGGQKNTRIGRGRYVHWLTYGHRRCRFGATSSPRLDHSRVGRPSLVTLLACTVASLRDAQEITGGGEGADGAEAEAEAATRTTKVVALGSAVVSAAMRMLFVRQLTVDVFSTCDVAYAGACGKGRR